ncbi:hypothetical protein [Streptomyces hokutonensis]|uniref:Uncharacterized protein n=1 Tax=Streptomyces hokutonensis TaxID=1306990 RepID=A0ABW6MCL0_9ACTN
MPLTTTDPRHAHRHGVEHAFPELGDTATAAAAVGKTEATR